MNPGCDYCKKETEAKVLKRCSKCLNAKYCSKECQISDWKKIHKSDCGNWQEEKTFIVSHLPKFKQLHAQMLKQKKPEIGVFRVSMDNKVKFNIGFVNSEKLKLLPTFAERVKSIDLQQNIVIFVSRDIEKPWNLHVFPVGQAH
jgi:hypothetical protein